MKKKSTILTIVAILCFIAALYFMRQETLLPQEPEEEYEEEEPEEDEPEEEPEEDPMELIPDIKPAPDETKTE